MHQKTALSGLFAKSSRLRLLVSVRDESEAAAAVEGGADIVDVKDPAKGSLGRADTDVLNAVLNTVGKTRPVTAALGELIELSDPASLASSLCGLSLELAKVGTAEITDARDCWRRWELLMDLLTADSSSPPVILAAYADHRRWGGFSPWELLDELEKQPTRFLLIDTFVKDGRRLLDWMSPEECRELAGACRSKGIRLALAGSLSLRDIEQLLMSPPDVIAVRGAACQDSRRDSSIDARRVTQISGLIRGGSTSLVRSTEPMGKSTCRD